MIKVNSMWDDFGHCVRGMSTPLSYLYPVSLSRVWGLETVIPVLLVIPWHISHYQTNIYN